MGDPDRIRTSHLNLILSYSFPIIYKLYLIINLHFKVRLSTESVNFLQIWLCGVKIIKKYMNLLGKETIVVYVDGFGLIVHKEIADANNLTTGQRITQAQCDEMRLVTQNCLYGLSKIQLLKAVDNNN